MKTFILTLLSVLFFFQLNAQTFELSVQANSGLFHYSGNSTTSSSFINGGTTAKNGYTNNPYGNKNGISYGADIQGQYIGKGGFIAGLQAGYDILRSKLNLTGVYPYYGDVISPPLANTVINPELPATGHTILQDQLINISPYIGYRFKIRKVVIDLMPGFDLGFTVNLHEYGKAVTSDGTVYQTDLDRGTHPPDFRLKLAVAATYKRVGITASFAHGLTNFTSDLLDDSPIDYQAHSELFRFGITYRIL